MAVNHKALKYNFSMCDELARKSDPSTTAGSLCKRFQLVSVRGSGHFWPSGPLKALHIVLNNDFALWGFVSAITSDCR